MMSWLRFALCFGSAIGGASAAQAAEPCEKLLTLRIPAREIGLPTRGAVIRSAVVVAASGELPETCRVQGDIIGSRKDAPPIKFQINFPRNWNGKAVQFGGGGFNGMLVDGLQEVPGSASVSDRVRTPLTLGYATFGSDGGHQATNGFDSAFGRNPEARENYTGAAVKRLRDTAGALLRRFYGTTPRRVYYVGGSKGGHEALIAAQRYGTDYDGIISYFPAKDSVGLILGWGALAQAAYRPGGAALSLQKQEFVQRAVVAACDGLDGLKDGVIANTNACDASISPVSLTCTPDQPATDACLTPAEAATLAIGLRRTPYPRPMANGVSEIGPFPVLSGTRLSPFMFAPGGLSETIFDKFTTGIVRDFWANDAAANFGSVDLQRLAPRILAHSQASDATSTNLDAFERRGGKMIIVQGTMDMLVPPSATTDYFIRLASRYGERTPSFVRYFVQPGYDHGGGPFTISWDSLAALESWVETGAFPANPVATDSNPATRGRQMPLCEYPLFPRYVGGEPRAARSFRCSPQ
jgi:hypothetical protein